MVSEAKTTLWAYIFVAYSLITKDKSIIYVFLVLVVSLIIYTMYINLDKKTP